MQIAGVWPHVKKLNRFVTCVADFPIIWIRKLQTDIVKSKMNTGYNRFGMCMQEVIPLKKLVWKMKKYVGALTSENMEPGMNTQDKICSEKPLVSFTSKPNTVWIESIESNKHKVDHLTNGLPSDRLTVMKITFVDGIFAIANLRKIVKTNC